MAATSIEDRLDAIEKELSEVKKRLEEKLPTSTIPWWEQISGTFKDCPAYDEAMRLGREWRESQRMEYDEPEYREEDHGSA